MNVEELTRQVEPEEKKKKKKKYSGWLIAAAAAVVVLVLGAAVLLMAPADDQAPVAPAPTTVPVAPAPTTVPSVVDQEAAPSTTTPLAATPTTEPAPTVPAAQAATIAALEAAWNDGNEDALRALFAPDAVLEDSEFGILDNIDKIVAWTNGRRAMEVVASIDDCVPADDAVRCTAEFDGVVPIALQQVPWRDNYTFSFEDGLISRIDTVCVICTDTVPELRMRDWVESIDDTVWESSFYGANLVSTPEKAAYFLEWAPKWQEAGRP